MSTPDTAFAVGLAFPGIPGRYGVEGTSTNANLQKPLEVPKVPEVVLTSGEEVDPSAMEEAYYSDFYNFSHNNFSFDLTPLHDCE